MTPLFLAYFIGAIAVLGLLAWMILRIGAVLGTCPNSGPAIRAAAITIATGFGAIGAGAVTLIAAAMPVLGGNLIALFLCLGFATFALGLGFSNAIATLRAITEPPKTEKAPAAAPA